MRGIRFSLLGLAGFVAAAAVACAALVYASPLVASAALMAALVGLMLATVLAVAGARQRGFWIGAALCGWIYLLAALGPFSSNFGGLLLTTTLTQRAAKAMPGASQAAQGYYFAAPAMPNPYASACRSPLPLPCPEATAGRRRADRRCPCSRPPANRRCRSWLPADRATRRPAIQLPRRRSFPSPSPDPMACQAAA
jgi:hypothetical protein